jgi:hypothetical protein
MGNTPLIKLHPLNHIWVFLFLRLKIYQLFPTPIENEDLPHFLFRSILPLFLKFDFPPLKNQIIILYILTQLLLILLYSHPVVLKELVHIPQDPLSQVYSLSITNFLKPFLITLKLLPLNPQWSWLEQAG